VFMQMCVVADILACERIVSVSGGHAVDIFAFASEERQRRLQL